MRILKIVNSADGGGVFNCEKQFIKELLNVGVGVDLVIVGDGYNKEAYTKMGAEYLTIPKINSFVGRNIAVFYKIYKSSISNKDLVISKFKERSYDAIIFRRQYFSFLGYFLARYFACALYWHIPGVIKSKFLKVVYQILLSRLNIIPIANSRYTRSTLGSICKYIVYPGFDKGRTSLAIDARLYREFYNIGEDATVYGVAARIYPGKGLKFVIGGMEGAGLFEENAILLIAGKIVDQEYWDTIVKEYGYLFGKKVFFLGEIDNIRSFYASIDILINGGIEAEAFGISVAEGLGSSKPVIAYGLGGPLEMIDDNVNGWIIKEPTIESYIEGFRRTKLSKERLIEVGRESWKKAEKFAVSSNVVHLIEIIKENKHE